MRTTKEDIDRIGLTHADWKALVLGNGKVDQVRLNSARKHIATIGKFEGKYPNETEISDYALRQIGFNYKYLWNEGRDFTSEESILYLQAKKGMTREAVLEHLKQVQEDNEELKRINKMFSE